jgi:glycosyltransferase involved in cell wall biosynthesis
VREAAAGAPNIEIRGRVPQAELVALLQSARAFVFPAEEDFGIGMVEAQACGAPLIVFGRGGARDIVTEDTGLVFEEQTVQSLTAAIGRFVTEEARFTPQACRANAERFGIPQFRAGLRAAVARQLP